MINLPPSGLGVADAAIVGSFGCLLLGIGVYFARRQRSTDDYFVAGRNQHPLLAGVSLFAALFTIVAYIGVPGEMVQNGPVLIVGSIAALPFSYWAISRRLIPAFMRLPITSGYELLEARLGPGVRLAASLTFIVVRLVWMALILYAAATVLIAVTGWDHATLPWLCAGIGAAATLYTLAGGIEAVMTMAVLEFILLLLGAALTFALVCYRTGSLVAWWPTHVPAHWPPEPFASFDPHIRVTAVGTFISYFVSTVCAGGSDQVAIQRYLTTRDIAAARRAVLYGHLTVGIILAALGVVGLSLLGYYRLFPAELPTGFALGRSGDALFPYFLCHGLPAGVSGLVVAGLLTSAVSGVSPSINSVIAVVNQEFVVRRVHAGQDSEAAKLRIARLLSLVIGAVIIVGSVGMAHVHGNLIEVSGKTVNLFFYPLFGLFALALFVPRVSPAGAILGGIYGLAAGVIVGYWDALTGLSRVSFQWIGIVAFVTTVGCGTVFSRLHSTRWSTGTTWTFTSAALVVLGAVFFRLIAVRS